MKRYLTRILSLLLFAAFSLAEPTAVDEFHESVRKAYLSGDKIELKALIEKQRSGNPSDAGAHLLEIYYYTIFESNREMLSSSLRQFESNYPEGKQSDSDLKKYLDPAREILALDAEKWDILESFPVSEGKKADPIFMLFFNPARGLSLAQASGRIETVVATEDTEVIEEDPVAKIPSVPPVPETVEAVEEVHSPETEKEESAEIALVEVVEETSEESSQWWLWLVGALVVVGALGLVLRRKS